ncbi:MAG: hypothetical protein KKD44_06610 [Proteobacteria bacterium]|nr:hypothetical protein [Pseudomonadota bacterium]
MQTTHYKNTTPDTTSSLHPTKWRRRGKERRLTADGSSKSQSDYSEKRTSSDRRFHFLEFFSKIIFPRGHDGFDH